MKVATHINKLYGGGAERVAANLSFYLNKKFNHFFILHRKTEDTYPHSGEIYFTKFAQKKVLPFFRFFRREKTLEQTKKELRPEIVISHLYGPNQSNILSKQQDKTIVVIHGKASLYNSALERQIAKANYPKADAVVTMSQFYKQRVIEEFKIGQKQVHCIHNPISLDDILKKSKEPIENEKEAEIFNNPVFINVGRINEVKAQWHAIRAFPQIVQTNPKAQLVFIGRKDDKITPYMEQLVVELNLENNVHLLGERSNPFKYMANAFAYISTSTREGFPMVLLEALACGLPIIATDCDSGPREILAPATDFMYRTSLIEQGEFGFLTPVCTGKMHTANGEPTENEQLISQAAISLLSDNNLIKIFQEGRSEYVTKFDLPSIGKQYESLIFDLVNERV